MRLSAPFDLLKNFLDPQLTKDGEPYGPKRYREIVYELYAISKVCNTSYTDLLTISPTERDIMLELVIKEQEEAEKAIKQIREKKNV